MPAWFPDKLCVKQAQTAGGHLCGLSSGTALGRTRSSFCLLLIEASGVPVLAGPLPGMENTSTHRARPCCTSTLFRLAHFSFPVQVPAFKTISQRIFSCP